MATIMARAVLGAFFTTTLLSTAVLGQQMCYFPNGSPSPNDTPCRSSGFTHCCNNQSICLGNGFCQSVEFQPYTLSRGSCTDQTWQSPNCPQRCKGTKDNPGGGAIISFLGVDGNGQSSYCCNQPVGNGTSIICPNNQSPFNLESGAAIFGKAFLANTTQSASASTTSPSSSSAPTAPAGSTNSTASSGNSTLVASSSSPSPTTVGVAVGAPLAALSLAMFAWAMIERSKRKRDSREMKGPESRTPYAPSAYPASTTYGSPGPEGKGPIVSYGAAHPMQPSLTGSSTGMYSAPHHTDTMQSYHHQQPSQHSVAYPYPPPRPPPLDTSTRPVELGSYRDAAQELAS